jgi:hypothetical protein
MESCPLHADGDQSGKEVGIGKMAGWPVREERGEASLH